MISADYLLVMSNAFDWDDKGVAVLGDVKIHQDGALVHFPLSKRNLSYLKDTTSTAM